VADALIQLRDVRDRAIAVLSDGFAHDLLDVNEFERRVTIAQTSDSVAEIEQLITDLPAPAAPPAPSPTALVPASEVREHQTMLSIMGGSIRKGHWVTARHLRVVNVMGGTVLDFRDAQMPAGVVDVTVIAVMGGCEIIVPPSLAVETDGVAIMGGFEHVDRRPAQLDPSAPLLRVHGIAFMGGVEIKMRLPGESDSDARRRRRRERKELRRAERAQRRLGDGR
jgi:hypothetical protein